MALPAHPHRRHPARGQVLGEGPNDFQINKTAASAGITADATGQGWRLELRSAGTPVVLDRAALLALPLHTARLPIACVEGWSTTDQ